MKRKRVWRIVSVALIVVWSVVTIVIRWSEMFAMATGESSGILFGSVEAYTFTFPLMRGAISHLTILFPTLFSSQTMEIWGAVPLQAGSSNTHVSKFNRFLYIVFLSEHIYAKIMQTESRIKWTCSFLMPRCSLSSLCCKDMYSDDFCYSRAQSFTEFFLL